MTVEDRLRFFGRLYEKRHQMLTSSQSAKLLFEPTLNQKSLTIAEASGRQTLLQTQQNGHGQMIQDALAEVAKHYNESQNSQNKWTHALQYNKQSQSPTIKAGVLKTSASARYLPSQSSPKKAATTYVPTSNIIISGKGSTAQFQFQESTSTRKLQSSTFGKASRQMKPVKVNTIPVPMKSDVGSPLRMPKSKTTAYVGGKGNNDSAGAQSSQLPADLVHVMRALDQQN